MDNAADEKQVKYQRQKIKNDEDQAYEDIKTIINTHAGFRFFKRLFIQGELTGISMTGNSWTYFKEGHRNFAKKIFHDVSQADYAKAGKILTEILSESKENRNDN